MTRDKEFGTRGFLLGAKKVPFEVGRRKRCVLSCCRNTIVNCEVC